MHKNKVNGLYNLHNDVRDCSKEVSSYVPKNIKKSIMWYNVSYIDKNVDTK